MLQLCHIHGQAASHTNIHKNMLPMFIYGTLLPTQANHFVISDAIVAAEEAVLPNAILFDLGGFPMLLAHPRRFVTGLLITFDAESYANTLIRLDQFEAYYPERPEDSLYRREQHNVLLRNRNASVEAWVYVGDKRTVAGLEPFGGDWVSYSAESRLPSYRPQKYQAKN